MFRCDGLACHIAGALRDICKKILSERNAREAAGGSNGSMRLGGGEQHLRGLVGGITRPNNLPNLGRVGDPPDGQHLTFESIYKSE